MHDFPPAEIVNFNVNSESEFSYISLHSKNVSYSDLVIIFSWYLDCLDRDTLDAICCDPTAFFNQLCDDVAYKMNKPEGD